MSSTFRNTGYVFEYRLNCWQWLYYDDTGVIVWSWFSYRTRFECEQALQVHSTTWWVNLLLGNRP